MLQGKKPFHLILEEMLEEIKVLLLSEGGRNGTILRAKDLMNILRRSKMPPAEARRIAMAQTDLPQILMRVGAREEIIVKVTAALEDLCNRADEKEQRAPTVVRAVGEAEVIDVITLLPEDEDESHTRQGEGDAIPPVYDGVLDSEHD